MLRLVFENVCSIWAMNTTVWTAPGVTVELSLSPSFIHAYIMYINNACNLISIYL